MAEPTADAFAVPACARCANGDPILALSVDR
jgi:hypothetical protein